MAIYKKPDFWSLKAQKESYPARSVYKLKEIDEKFNFFIHQRYGKKSGGQAALVNKAALRVLDLGAAPGSWSLYVLRHYGKYSRRQGSLFLAAVDLVPLSRHFEFLNCEDFFFIQGDFTAEAVRKELLNRGPYNVIISDAAPPTTGSRTVDTRRSFSLVEEALSLAETCLAPGGNLAVKVFQGEDTAALLKRIRGSFNSAKNFKPQACRGSSFETYYIGLGKRREGIPKEAIPKTEVLE